MISDLIKEQAKLREDDEHEKKNVSLLIASKLFSFLVHDALYFFWVFYFNVFSFSMFLFL